MSLFEIFDEITEKQVVKTELGSERMFGITVGIVAENYSEKMPGRICVNIPDRDENANQLKWVKYMRPYAGDGHGFYFQPEKGDEVVLAFIDGNIEEPIALGCIPRDKDKFLKKSVSEKNQKKEFRTRNGSRVTIEDDENEDGMKDRITVSTAGDAHQIVLDNEKKQMIVTDNEKNCRIEMESEKGEISIHAEKKLTVTVGDSIVMTMNGSNGSVKIEAQKVAVEAGKSLRLNTDGNASLSGRQTVVTATSTFKASSSGIAVIEGKPVKMG